MSKKVVLVTDYTWPSTEPEAKVLAEVGAVLSIAESGSEEELVSLVREADAILTCFAQVTPKVVESGKKLQVIGRYGIGVDNIAVEKATELGIPVTNVPVYCLDEVAEHALALMLACARKIPLYDRNVRAGNWDLKRGIPLYRLREKTLGIVAFGKIGRTLAEKATGLGMRILAHDPFLEDAQIRQGGAESVNLETVIQQSDFLSLHSPLTSETEHLINEERLHSMKSTAFLINTARGGLIDFDALYKALKEDWIAGAGVDVFVPERFPADHPLLQLPNFIATPHVAFYTEESVMELETMAAQNVAAILSGRRPTAVVNPQVLELPRWAHLT